jgi:hypothetical protein
MMAVDDEREEALKSLARQEIVCNIDGPFEYVELDRTDYVLLQRNSRRLMSIRNTLDEYEMKRKLLAEHQKHALNRLRGKTIQTIKLFLESDWNG